MKTADCIVPRAHAFFQSLPIHAQLCISKNRSFFLVFSRSLAHGKKKKEKKSYIVLSFDLNLQDNLEQTVTTPSTQLEKSTKNDQQTKGKKKRKKKNKAQSKAQSEEQNRVEMVTDNRLVEDPPGKI